MSISTKKVVYKKPGYKKKTYATMKRIDPPPGSVRTKREKIKPEARKPEGTKLMAKAKKRTKAK